MTMISRSLAVAALCVLASTLAQAGSARPVVVELFTSQGSNACPPADQFLGKLAQQRDVIALSLPVTYWDMLGWKDTLASESNTRRQKGYAAAMGHGGVYTPQIVIDGAQDVVGSRVAGVEAAIEARRHVIEAGFEMIQMPVAASSEMAARNSAAGDVAMAAKPANTPQRLSVPFVPVSVSENAQEMRIKIGAADGVYDATVWMFHLRSAVNVAIKAGENQGRTITYRNIVADLRAVGVWKGGSLSLTLPRSAMTGLPHDGVAIVVQQAGFGQIMGASYIARPDFYPSH